MYNEIICKYYQPASEAYRILMRHSMSVADKALAIVDAHPEMLLDRRFVHEASMLHDLGVFLCDAPEIDCHGAHPYVCHGYLGAELLRQEGLERHARVCERHTGTGISLEAIIKGNLPLPHRDLMPETLEEQVICFADKFFSKTNLEHEKSLDKVRKSLGKWCDSDVARFNHWCDMFL
jgi:uncharacterized protein